jgi:hypothetical protein
MKQVDDYFSVEEHVFNPKTEIMTRLQNQAEASS